MLGLGNAVGKKFACSSPPSFNLVPSSLPVGNHRASALVTWRVAAQQPQNIRTRIPELVPLPRQNRNRISAGHLADFPVNANSSHPTRDVINLLRLGVIMLRVLAPGASRASARL